MNKKKPRKPHTLKKPKYTDPKFFETPEFVKLNTQWMDKLKESGFDDAEDILGPNEYLKEWHSQRFQIRYRPEDFLLTRDYYLRAAELLNTINFTTARDRKIWMMHADGVPERTIAESLGITDWRVRKLIKSMRSRIRKVS